MRATAIVLAIVLASTPLGPTIAQDGVTKSNGLSLFGDLKYGPDFAHFGGCVAAGAPQKILGHSVDVRVLRLADKVKRDLHSGGISSVLALRQRRSSP